jgi:hypothetical protein
MALFKKVFDTHSDALTRGDRPDPAAADLRNIFAVDDTDGALGNPPEDAPDTIAYLTDRDEGPVSEHPSPAHGDAVDSFDFASPAPEDEGTEAAFLLSPGLRAHDDPAFDEDSPEATGEVGQDTGGHADPNHDHDHDHDSTEDGGRDRAEHAAPDIPDAHDTPDPAELARRQIAAMQAQGMADAPAPGGGEDTPRPPAGRVRTRLLGFTGGDSALPRDPMHSARTAAPVPFPVGWIVVTRGPGRGAHFPLAAGVSLVGRGAENSVCLDFGDTAISRQNHAAIAYDDEAQGFYLGHGGKSNIIRLNGRPVLSTEEIGHGDEIRIGETVLRLVALCGSGFSWSEAPGHG